MDRVEGAPQEADLHGCSSRTGRGSAASHRAGKSARFSSRSPSPRTAETGTTSMPSRAPRPEQRQRVVGARRPGESRLLAATSCGRSSKVGSQRRTSSRTRCRSATGSSPAHPRGVHHVQQDARALDVTQELEAQAGALRGALDDPRDVGGHQRALVDLDHPQHRGHGREGIVADLGAGRGDAREESRLAGVREAEESHVGDEPEVEAQPALLAGLRRARPRAVPGCGSRGRRGCPRPPRPPRATTSRSPSRSTSPENRFRGLLAGGGARGHATPAGPRRCCRCSFRSLRAAPVRAELGVVAEGQQRVLVGNRRRGRRRRPCRPGRRRGRRAARRASRRKLAQPFPPSPPLTKTLTRSTNMGDRPSRAVRACA